MYKSWNTALGEHFFREELAGKEVFLFVDESLILDLAKKHDLPSGSFLRSVDAPGRQSSQIARACLDSCNRGRWRITRPAAYPPYLVYLAIFSLAAGLDEQTLPDNAYYNRLRRYLGLPDGGQLPGFDRLGDEVWKDLEAWSAFDMDGQLGIFRVRIHGQHRHVGIPRSQTLLWEEELKALPRIFAAAQLDPTDDPTDHVLIQAMERGAGVLRRSTRRTLLRPKADVLKSALLDVIRSELAEWDGTIPESSSDVRGGQVFGHLRLCLQLNFGKMSGLSTLRCTLASPYPDHTLILTDGTDNYSCDELLAPWSTRLVTADGKPLDASHNDWESGLTLLESTLGWKFTMRGSKIRVFESAEGHGLPGWVEVSRLEHDKKFLIAFHDNHRETLLTWAAGSCASFRVLHLSGVLPGGWSLIEVFGVRDDAGIRLISPSIGLASTIQVRLTNGLRRGRGSKYYAFAPPQAQVSGLRDGLLVSVGDVLLRPDGQGSFPLPENLPLGELVRIAVRDGDQLVASQTLILVEQIDWTATPAAFRVDSYGEPTTGSGICGAFADSQLVQDALAFRPAVVLPPASTALLLGRRPGQVREWPSEPWPEWEPIWAITPPIRGRRHPQAIYCGSTIDSSLPLSRDQNSDRRALRKWKEATWIRRKRTVPPTNKRLRALWDEYVKAES